MADETGGTTARAGGIVAAVLAVAALGAGGGAPPRDPVAEPMLSVADARRDGDPEAMRALVSRPKRDPVVGPTSAMDGAVAPLPGAGWQDPDSVNWADIPNADRSPLRERLMERRAERGPLPGGRLLDRLRDSRDEGRRAGDDPPAAATTAASTGWPAPVRLREQLAGLAAAPAEVAAWAAATATHLEAVCATTGPADPGAVAALLPLGDDVDAGVALADRIDDATLSTRVRRTALAAGRRVAVWRGAAA
ncbi:MAG: hypothetical protein ACKOZU_05360, partial [Planctomycetaceae bacterium]